MTYRSRIDLGVAAVVIAIGTVFGIEAWRIDPASYEAIGPRFVPLFLCLAMIALGALIGIAALVAPGAEAPPEAGFGFRDTDLGRVAAVIGAGIAYVFAFWALGYFVATIIAAALALFVFGVRAPVILILGAVAAGVVYQVVFMGLMGLLDPRGELLDLRSLSRLVTPGS